MDFKHHSKKDQKLIMKQKYIGPSEHIIDLGERSLSRIFHIVKREFEYYDKCHD